VPATPRRNAVSPIALAAVAVIGLALAVLSVGALGAEPTGEVAAITGTPATSPSPAPTATPRPTPSPTPVPTPTPSPIPTPTPTPVPTPVPTPKPVLSMNLYRTGDFVSQATKEQCVSAAMQIMLNIIRPKDDRSKAFQARLADLAQELSDASNGGTEPRGWARGLEQLGGGKY
jgi:outer membrane biosynthesis protein TonB